MDLPEYEQLALFEVEDLVYAIRPESLHKWSTHEDAVVVSVPKQVVQEWRDAARAYRKAQYEKGVYYDAARTASSSSDLAPAFTD